MKEFNLTFKVSRDEEAKKAGESVEVKTTVIIHDTDMDRIYANALANRKIQWQANIKAGDNWDKFLKDGFPERINFSDLPFPSTRVAVREMTQEEMIEHIKGLPPEEREEFLKKAGLL